MRCEGETSVFPSRGANVEKQETGGTTNDEIIKFSCFVGQQANEYICVATRGSIFVLSFRQSELTDALFSIDITIFHWAFRGGGAAAYSISIVSCFFDAQLPVPFGEWHIVFPSWFSSDYELTHVSDFLFRLCHLSSLTFERNLNRRVIFLIAHRPYSKQNSR